MIKQAKRRRGGEDALVSERQRVIRGTFWRTGASGHGPILWTRLARQTADGVNLVFLRVAHSSPSNISHGLAIDAVCGCGCVRG